jgi:hypothetical protein
MLQRANWSRPLPRPLVIPKVMTLKTPADVREHMRHLPEDRRERSTWRYVAALLADAAASPDAADVSIRASLSAGVGGGRTSTALKGKDQAGWRLLPESRYFFLKRRYAPQIARNGTHPNSK